MKKASFSFSVLRYIHDVIGGEFINAGVVLYSPEHSYLRANISTKYGRISKTFYEFDGYSFQRYVGALQNRINAHGDELDGGWLFPSSRLAEVLSSYLTADDSAFQFGPIHSGVTSDPQAELDRLFNRYVTLYVKPEAGERRKDEDIWNAFKQKIPNKGLLSKLQPHLIRGSVFEQEFEHTWKNDRLHIAEPLSFDLIEPDSIRDKAAKWAGRILGLGNAEDFKLDFIVGFPSDPKLLETAHQMERFLKNSSDRISIIPETEGDRFAKELSQAIEEHSKSNQ
jgi:hypothetical protein